MQEYPKILWSGTTKTRKLGNIPVASVGSTREESFRSCQGCPHLGVDCYSQHGTPAMGHASMVKSYAKRGPSYYSLKRALLGAARSAKYVRFTTIGDAARANPALVREQHDEVRREGFGWISYTHFPWEVVEQGNQDLYCASVETMEDADRALQEGFKRATVVAPWDAYKHGQYQRTPSGEKGVICPAMWAHSKDKRVTCNQCGLCDPKASGPRVVIFPNHGPGTRKKLIAAAKAGAEWAKNLLYKL